MFVEKKNKRASEENERKNNFSDFFFLNEFMENTRTRASLRIPRFTEKNLSSMSFIVGEWCGHLIKGEDFFITNGHSLKMFEESL